MSVAKNKIALLFTVDFPCGKSEITFLKREVEILAAEFKRIYVIPERAQAGLKVEIPASVTVERSYAAEMRATARNLLRACFLLFNGDFLRECLLHPSFLLRRESLTRLLKSGIQAELTRSWIEGFLRREKLSAEECICYTYWFCPSSVGLLWFKRLVPALKVVSRAHGIDLYEERHSPPIIPFRERSVREIDAIYPDSDRGSAHLRELYPDAAAKIETHRLGAQASGFLNKASSDGVLRFISCSFIVPVKRVDLMMDGLLAAARRRPELKIEWRHYGLGAFEEIVRRAGDALPSNLKVEFPGYSSAADLLKEYASRPVDAFMNLSSTEGTPVAAMEAVSCGMPLIVTGVGGNTEIASNGNGVILSANPSPDEVADAILRFADEPAKALEMRSKSFEHWKAKYDTDANFALFIKRLESLD